MTNGFRGLLMGWGEPIYVKLKEVEKLAVRHFKFTLFCLQDWLTLLGFSQPDLFYVLDCEYNVQESLVYRDTLNLYTADQFTAWHACDKPAKILHHNG